MDRKEVDFYMTRRDEEAFLNFVFSTGDVIIKFEENKGDSIYAEDKYNEFSSTVEFYQYIESKLLNNIIHCNFVLRTHHDEDKINKELFPGNTLISKRDTDNAVIGYSRCGYIKNRITNGELIYYEKWYDCSGSQKIRDKTFTKWYNKIARWIRTTGYKATWDGVKPVWNCYILPDAVDFFKNGGLLDGWRERCDIVDLSIRPLGYPLVRTEQNEPYYDLFIYLTNNYRNFFYFLKIALMDEFRDVFRDEFEIVELSALTIDDYGYNLILKEIVRLAKETILPVNKIEASLGKDFNSAEDARKWLEKFYQSISNIDQIERERIVKIYQHYWSNDQHTYELHTNKSIHHWKTDFKVWNSKLKKYEDINEEEIIKVLILVKMSRHGAITYVLNRFL